MAELFAKDTGTCRGTGGSMHIYDVDTHFQVSLKDTPTLPLTPTPSLTPTPTLTLTQP